MTLRPEMEKRIMSNASNLDHRELTETELDAVSGGTIPGDLTDMGQLDTSEATARRPLGTSATSAVIIGSSATTSPKLSERYGTPIPTR